MSNKNPDIKEVIELLREKHFFISADILERKYCAPKSRYNARHIISEDVKQALIDGKFVFFWSIFCGAWTPLQTNMDFRVKEFAKTWTKPHAGPNAFGTSFIVVTENENV